MSDESLLSMDEGALRKLLEATLDLAERRQIRAAIRELRRQELERDEESLASKRFRPERSTERQENKENWLRSKQLEEEQQKSLALLSGKLESIQDVEELTALLRGASEYEERKLIRAAIRKLRTEEIEAAALVGRVYSSQRGNNEPLSSKEEESATDGGISEAQELAEREQIRAQIRALRSEQRKEAHQPDAQDAVSGTVLLLDPLPNQPSPTLSSPSPELDLDLKQSTEGQECDSHSAGSSTKPEHSWKEESPDSTSTEEDNEAFSQPAAGGGSAIFQKHLEQQREPTPAPQSEEAHPRLPSNSSQQFVSQAQDGAPKKAASAADREQAVPPHNVPSTPAHLDAQQCDPTPPTRHLAVSTELRREQPFQRAGSVRERARKFATEPLGPPSPRPSPLRGESVGRGSRILQQQQQFLGPQRVADLPGGARGGLRRAAKDGMGLGGICRAGTEQRTTTTSSQATTGTVKPPTWGPAGPKEADVPGGRSQGSQWQGSQLTSTQGPVENSQGDSAASEESSARLAASSPSPAQPRSQVPSRGASEHDTMKTLFTIEIKDNRSQPIGSRIVGTPGSQRAELTVGLRSTPVRITTTSSGTVASSNNASSTGKMDAELSEQLQTPEPELPDSTEKETVQVKELQQWPRLNAESLSCIEEEEVLDKMLDQTTDFEERRLIRAAMRELRQRKREQREKERDQRLQETKTKRAGHATETTTQQSTTSADGSAVSTVTKTQRLIQSNDGSKSSRMMTVESSYVKRSENGSTFVQTKSSYSSSKKVGSIFEREDESAGRASSLAALERRQAEKKKELLKAQSLPKTSASQARKAMIEKLEKESGSPANPAVSRVAVQRSSSFGVPNANSIKQMLLDWCRAKTRGYEHVDIQNFSSSWSDGMAFCALVHNFFPEAFDYAQLSPQNRRANFEVAFSSAEKHAECPQLLDVEDMVRMREPDWKCVYTYIQEFYRCLVQKGLVKTKKS
uniref:Smoothelin n=1 Tax=Sphenodon punctatus TaxID=8508 RepID=A0A8D0GIT4_SPHPU